ncbi:alpha-N-acetylneuraminide alpha-2,8-sialyltransferase-like [Branchiostoma floridae]|uniref:Alpha-N-acetylneuraminide alpha-2,8-sialyltransferase-like n=1 Tax=Branchiostoma floridae TaxID=7739 RepID=A0A9J7HND3_BRAFL|nr:alpha-N-acetylneuraminide alpha-2,8-sialyltransferase-like [Branchiostoma floridae]
MKRKVIALGVINLVVIGITWMEVRHGWSSHPTVFNVSSNRAHKFPSRKERPDSGTLFTDRVQPWSLLPWFPARREVHNEAKVVKPPSKKKPVKHTPVLEACHPQSFEDDFPGYGYKKSTTEETEWKFNYTAIEELRESLEKCCRVRDLFIATRQNVPKGSLLRFDGDKSVLKITHRTTGLLPQNSSLSGQFFKSCSVVGNGGILMGSKCGNKIDTSEFVIRCNLAPVNAVFSEDVGSKTSLITLNPSILEKKYKKLSERGVRNAFLQDISAYNDSLIWIPAFSYRRNMQLAYYAHKTLQGANAQQRVVFPHPNHLRMLGKYWSDQGLPQGKRLSTGLFLASAAISYCQEVHLYGFWPFDVNCQGNNVTYHYYDKGYQSSGHSMSSEFVQLLKLQDKRVVHITTEKCQP